MNLKHMTRGYGGLRTPSETLALTWQDIDWERKRLYVRSPKTERFEDKEGRMSPMIPELRPYIEKCFELTEDGAEHVITKYRLKSANLRTQFHRIIKRAGQ